MRNRDSAICQRSEDAREEQPGFVPTPRRTGEDSVDAQIRWPGECDYAETVPKIAGMPTYVRNNYKESHRVKLARALWEGWALVEKPVSKKDIEKAPNVITIH